MISIVIGLNQICYSLGEDGHIQCDDIIQNPNKNIDVKPLQDIFTKEQFVMGQDFICQISIGILECIGEIQIIDKIPHYLKKFEIGSAIFEMKASHQNICVIYIQKQLETIFSCWGSPQTLINNIPKEIEFEDLVANLKIWAMGPNSVCVFLEYFQSLRYHCWGQCPDGMCEIPARINLSVLELSLGYDHACAIQQNELICWGNNSSNQVSIPNEYKQSSSIVKLGNQLTCVLKGYQNRLQCWGDTDNKFNFLELKNSVYQISTGGRHTCAVRRQNQECWGLNEQGQLDIDGSKFSGFRAEIKAGWDFTCYIDTKLIGRCLGFNYLGQIDIPDVLEEQNQVQNDSGEIIGLIQNINFDKENKNNNNNYKFNYSNTLNNDNAISQEILKVECGLSHSCELFLISNTPRIVCWGGWNEQGQTSPPPMDLTNQTIEDIAVGDEFTCIVLNIYSIRVKCWGNNSTGQLDYEPTTFVEDDFEIISAGGAHVCIVTSTVFCWGSNSHGQTSIPSGQFFQESISAGNAHTCGFDPDHQVVCWGLVTFIVEDKLEGFDLSTSQENLCVIDHDFKGKCIGDNEWGQTSIKHYGEGVVVSL